MGEENIIGAAATEVGALLADLGTSAMPVVLAAVAIGLGFFGVNFIVSKGKKAVK